MDENSKRKLPNWLLDLQSGHKASLPQLEFCGSVIYSNMLGECGFACEEILEENSHLDEIILGFDTEWPVTYRSNESSSSRTSLIQICAQKEKCYLFHVNNLRRLPLAMIHLMEHPKTKLVGVNIASDLWKLGRDFDISVKSIIETKVIDLGKYANEVLQCSQNWSLAGLVLHVLKMDINKDITVRKSNWTVYNLSQKQKKYAATDAFAAYVLYLRLKQQEKKEDNGSFC